MKTHADVKPAMRIVIRPVAEPQREIDLTARMVSAIAEELWRLYGGDDRFNWLEAERHLQRIVDGARRGAAEALPERRRQRIGPGRGAGRGHRPRPPTAGGAERPSRIS